MKVGEWVVISCANDRTHWNSVITEVNDWEGTFKAGFGLFQENYPVTYETEIEAVVERQRREIVTLKKQIEVLNEKNIRLADRIGNTIECLTGFSGDLNKFSKELSQCNCGESYRGDKRHLPDCPRRG